MRTNAPHENRRTKIMVMSETEVQQFVGKNVNEIPASIAEWYPVVNENMTVIQMVNAYDYSDDLTLVDDMYLREATPAEYSHGCRHEWEVADDMVFTKGKNTGSSCDVFCDKCHMGAFLDEQGNVILSSIAQCEINL